MSTLKTKKQFYSLAFLCATLLAISSCSEQSKEDKVFTDPFVAKIEKAHKKDIYLNSYASQFEIKIEFGGNERLDGKLTLTNDSRKGKIELKSGEEILFLDDKVYASESLDEGKVRFDAYTWSYFFQFAYKLSDNGTIWSEYKSESESYDAKKLSFTSGTGDAPDDWYVVYTNPETNLINHSAYIVTAHGGKEKAEKNPHAIVYTDYKEVNKVPVAHKWTFKNWSKETGLGSSIGKASISNFKFISSADKVSFEKKESFKEIAYH